jgi:hypothetical protein
VIFFGTRNKNPSLHLGTNREKERGRTLTILAVKSEERRNPTEEK